jgi:hypothetical protein
MPQFAFAGCQSTAYLSKRMSLANLAEKHGYKLSPACKTTGMSVSLVLGNGSLEFNTRK